MRWIVSGIAVVMLISAGAAFSHPPGKVELKYEEETHILHVTFEHKVRDAKQHFIYRVRVRVNKEDMIEQKLEIQDDTNGGSLIYKITGAKAGDKIDVRLDCVKGGSKTGKLVIG